MCSVLPCTAHPFSQHPPLLCCLPAHNILVAVSALQDNDRLHKTYVGGLTLQLVRRNSMLCAIVLCFLCGLRVFSLCHDSMPYVPLQYADCRMAQCSRAKWLSAHTCICKSRSADVQCCIPLTGDVYIMMVAASPHTAGLMKFRRALFCSSHFTTCLSFVIPLMSCLWLLACTCRSQICMAKQSEGRAGLQQAAGHSAHLSCICLKIPSTMTFVLALL